MNIRNSCGDFAYTCIHIAPVVPLFRHTLVQSDQITSQRGVFESVGDVMNTGKAAE